MNDSPNQISGPGLTGAIFICSCLSINDSKHLGRVVRHDKRRMFKVCHVVPSVRVGQVVSNMLGVLQSPKRVFITHQQTQRSSQLVEIILRWGQCSIVLELILKPAIVKWPKDWGIASAAINNLGIMVEAF
jgi:hypothetical protein